MQYKQLQPNQEASFGTQGLAVSQLQQSLNEKNSTLPGYTPLAVDGKYGPLTQSAMAFQPKTQSIVSSTPARNDYITGSSLLDRYTGEQDPYVTAFNTMMQNTMKTNEQTESDAIATATTSASRTRDSLEKNKQAYTAGLETAGVQSGASRYLPEYQSGIIADAKQKYVEKFQQVDNAEQLAIARARTARMTGDVALLNEQLNLIKELRKEKADALENAQKMDWEKYKFEEEMAFNKQKEARQAQNDAIKLSRSGGSGGGSASGGYTKQELRKLRQAGINASDIDMADDFLYGKGQDMDKKTFLSGLNQIVNSKDSAKIDNGDVPFFYKGQLTKDGFTRLSEVAGESGMSREDFLKAVKPYVATGKKARKNYGVTKEEKNTYLE